MPLAIAKTLLPDTATFYVALGRVFGLGKATGLAIAEEVGISKEARVMDVKASHVRQARARRERAGVGPRRGAA
jgi:ribosomal protein S13